MYLAKHIQLNQEFENRGLSVELISYVKTIFVFL